MRAELVCRTWPGPTSCTPRYTALGTTSPAGTSGRSRASLSIPFCTLTVTVSGPHRAASHGPIVGVWVTFTHTNTMSTTPTSAGEVTTWAGCSVANVSDSMT